MTDHIPASFSHLTPDEAEFVYNVEILGLPVRKAANLAGMSATKISAPLSPSAWPAAWDLQG